MVSVSRAHGMFTGPNTTFRLLTIMVGAIVVGLTAHSYARGVDQEKFFFLVSLILLVISLTLVILIFFGLYTESVTATKVDSIYQVTGGVVLLVGSGFMLVSVINQGKPGSLTIIYAERLTASILGMLNGFIYIFLGFLCRATRTNDKFTQRRTSTISTTRIA